MTGKREEKLFLGEGLAHIRLVPHIRAAHETCRKEPVRKPQNIPHCDIKRDTFIHTSSFSVPLLISCVCYQPLAHACTHCSEDKEDGRPDG